MRRPIQFDESAVARLETERTRTMNYRTIGVPTLLAAACLLQACEQVKSETPMSPSIAGPIAGVEITPPEPVQPTPGARLRTNGPPVTLVVQNASTNGVRPLSYAYEVGLDAAFSDVVLSAKGVAPGPNGQTSFQVPEALVSGRAYFWRARAEDGANASSFSSARNFLVVDPPVLFAPVPLAPIDGTRVGSITPTLRVANAGRTGDVQAVFYAFQVSTSSGFESIVASGIADEEPVSTQASLDASLEFNRTYFWRARAHESTTESPWSNAAVFLTPLGTAPSGGGSGGGGGGGSLPPGTPCPLPSGSGPPNAAEGTALVACIKSDLVNRGFNLSGTCGAFEITLRVTWALRDRGARLELWPGTSCNGYSHDIVLFMPSGESVDIL
ncbi:MAG TPA: hypothetical protein VMM93_05950, partial [Vicinamibacterales bacterium]|nr:hypothetical protein [Vicinamibacterales bacterium]